MPRKCLDASLRVLGWLRTRPLAGHGKRQIAEKTYTERSGEMARTVAWSTERRFPVAAGGAWMPRDNAFYVRLRLRRPFRSACRQIPPRPSLGFFCILVK